MVDVMGAEGRKLGIIEHQGVTTVFQIYVYHYAT